MSMKALATLCFALATVPVRSALTFAVEYGVASSCDGLPVLNGHMAPCGPGINFYVVIAKCPVGADSGCWDDVPWACTEPKYGMPNGGCLPALPAATAGTFTTVELNVPDSPERFLLASVYFTEPFDNGTFWHMGLDLAVHVPLTHSTEPVALAPFFNPFATGSTHQIPKLDVPEFDAYMAATMYLPPPCTENHAACRATKVVVVTDGNVAQMPSVLPLLVSNADALAMQRRSRPLALLYVSPILTFDNGTADPCSRAAMYTIGPSVPSTPQVDQCAGQFGKADAFLEFIQGTALPLARDQFHGVGTGQKAGIIGFSYGGLVSCYAAWARPDVFDAAGCGSPSFWYPSIDNCSEGLNGTDFHDVTMATFPAPIGTQLFVSDGTSETSCMGGSTEHPGAIPLTVAAMRSAGMKPFAFEQNEGYEHTGPAAWFANTMWRALSAIAPYSQSL
jgi:hypothetical protein